jgi:hypothetical protein
VESEGLGDPICGAGWILVGEHRDRGARGLVGGDRTKPPSLVLY